MPHLVTSKTLSRRPLSARATAVSEWPLPYAGAVSTQLTPASIAAWIALTASSISIAPYRSPDIGQVPNPIAETCSLVRPNRRYCIIRLRWQDQLGRDALWSGRRSRPARILSSDAGHDSLHALKEA